MQTKTIYTALIIDDVTIYSKTVFSSNHVCPAFPYILSSILKVSYQNIAVLSTLHDNDIWLPINFSTAKKRYMISKLFRNFTLKSFVYHIITNEKPGLICHTYTLDGDQFVKANYNVSNPLFKARK